MSVKKETGSLKVSTFKVTFKRDGKSYSMKLSDTCDGCMGELFGVVCVNLPECGDYIFLKELNND